MDVGVLLVPQPRRTAALAKMVEELGFASLALVDSQNLAPEVWSHLMVAAGATTRIRPNYDMRVHTRAGAAHTAGVDDDFVDWFGLAGPVARVLPRFVQLAGLGLDFVHVIPASTGVPREIAVGSLLGLGQGLLPALQTALRASSAG